MIPGNSPDVICARADQSRRMAVISLIWSGSRRVESRRHVQFDAPNPSLPSQLAVSDINAYQWKVRAHLRRAALSASISFRYLSRTLLRFIALLEMYNELSVICLRFAFPPGAIQGALLFMMRFLAHSHLLMEIKRGRFRAAHKLRDR